MESDIPFSTTPGQVGGYEGATIHNNGDWTATVTIPNDAGLHSLSYHLLDDLETDHGPLSTIHRTFEWTWPINYTPWDLGPALGTMPVMPGCA
jgi:hypothetical protein